MAPSSSADRAYHHANGKAVPAKVPATPRKETSQSRDRMGAVQDPGLKDYRLGDCIGKGAFGSVYKAFNWGTGEAVAVKQIRLADLPKSELRMIEAEIDLLKNLHHEHVVKYIGFVKSADCLNIILEFCENGSLHSICKAYGKFPENLVGVYMTQVLSGLQYLHDQGVIHRDIKGANILTNKDGTVKLADFGVSTNTLAGPEKEAQVVGTPYWMAPEIIQLSGATPASDIWSVGCTVIELLQGKPPYHNLAAMPALFAIVNDDHPPLPEGVSPAGRDFLMQCFQKDPNLRVSARKLGRHPWIVGCRRPSDAPVPKNIAVEEVVRWNRALESSDNNHLRASTGSDSSGPHPFQGHPGQRSGVDPHRATMGTPAKGPLALPKPRRSAEAFRTPELADDDNWDNDFATAISPSALQLPHLKPQDNFGGMLSADRLKAFASIDECRNVASNWDDDFDAQLMTIKGPQHVPDPDPQERTIRPPPKTTEKATKSPKAGRRRGGRPAAHVSQPKSPAKSQFANKFELPSRPEALYREQSVEDYSDLFADNDSVFTNRPNLVVRVPPPPTAVSRSPELLRTHTPLDSPQLFHPSDLVSLPRSMQPPTGGSMRRQASSRPSVLPDRPMRRTRSSVEIERFAENGDEDFSDIFGPEDALTERDESDRSSEDGGLMLLSKLSNNSWLGDEEDEDDPFAMIDPGWDQMDLEANIARDRHARLAEKVEELVRSLKQDEGEDRLDELSEDLLELLWENSEVKNLIISAHGLLPILEILEPCTVKSRQPVILQLLKIVNAIILDDVELQENLCFVGGIPIITKFAARQYSNEIRLEAAAFVRQMYQTSTTTLQMFVSAGGLNVLVEFLDEDYDSSRDLVLIGVNGIWNVFELQGPTPKNDFCRIFSRSKILDPLALVLHKVLDEDKDDLSELIEGRIVSIFYLFSQAENYVKEVVAERHVLKTVLKDLGRMTPIHQVTMLKFIKNLSMLSTTIKSLHSADAIDFLVDVLSHSIKKGEQHFREISNQVLNTMFNLCRLSKERQEYAAVNGIIPLLMKIMQTDRPPKEFALPILCDMAHSGKGRRYLWQNKGLDFYVSLLADQYWQVTALDAIFVWLQEETAKVEKHLLEGKFTGAIVSCFNTRKINDFDPNLLEPLLKVLRLSPAVAAELATSDMYAGIAQKLSHKKAVVRLNLLRLVRNVLDACDAGTRGGAGSQKQLRALLDAIRDLADQDSAVLVRNLASELVRAHIDSKTPPGSTILPSAASSSSSSAAAAAAATAALPNGSSRSRSGPRRTTSYTPPGLASSVSAPPRTPTHDRRHRPSQSTSGAYIEVAATPRRTAALERESLYRPRSRDGAASSSASSSSSIPRRVSGDATQVSLAAKSGTTSSRLPRQSTASSERAPRPTSAVLRSESSLSNKENFGGGAAGASAGTAGAARGYRRPSAAGTGPWTAGGSGASGPERETQRAAGGAAAGGRGSAGATGAASGSGKRRPARERPPSSDARAQSGWS